MARNEDMQMQAVFKSSRVDPISGNEVPPGSLPHEVRDDIPAMLSEGEYVIPADVLRYYGVKYFEDLRNGAKQGLAHMDATGRIGGDPVKAAEGVFISPEIRSEIRHTEDGSYEVFFYNGKMYTSYQDARNARDLDMADRGPDSYPNPVDQQMQEVLSNTKSVGDLATKEDRDAIATVVGYEAAPMVGDPLNNDDINTISQTQSTDNSFNPSSFGQEATDVAFDISQDMNAQAEAEAQNTTNQNISDEDTVMGQAVTSNKGYVPSNVDVQSWSDSRTADEPVVGSWDVHVMQGMVRGAVQNGTMTPDRADQISDLTGVKSDAVQAYADQVMGRSTSMDENITGMGETQSGGRDVSQAEVEAIDMIGDLAAIGIFGADTADTGTIGDISSISGDSAPSNNSNTSGSQMSGNMSAALQGYSMLGEYAGTPTAGDDRGGYGNLAGDYSGYGGGNEGPSGDFGGGDGGMSGAASAAEGGFGSSPGGEFGGAGGYGGGDVGTGSDNDGDGFGDMGGISGGWNKGGMVGYTNGGQVAQLPFDVPSYINLPNIPGVTGVATPGASTGGIEYRRYANKAGMSLIVPFFNGSPIGFIPSGYFPEGEVSPAPKKTQERPEDNYGGMYDGGQGDKGGPTVNQGLDGLADWSGNGKIGPEDTLAGDIFGLDGKIGIQGPGIKGSLMGARRDYENIVDKLGKEKAAQAMDQTAPPGMSWDADKTAFTRDEGVDVPDALGVGETGGPSGDVTRGGETLGEATASANQTATDAAISAAQAGIAAGIAARGGGNNNGNSNGNNNGNDNDNNGDGPNGGMGGVR